MELSDQETEGSALCCAIVLERLRRDGAAPPDWLCQLAGRYAGQASPPTALRIWNALRGSGETGWSAAVAGSKMDAREQPPPPSEPPVTAVQAARKTELSDRAIRAACASGRLPARKGPAGKWLIDPRALEIWRRERDRAA